MTFAKLNTAIDGCRVCAAFAPDFAKPKAMYRGGSASILIVGQNPGATELSTLRAFSGPAGKKLDQWLIASGAPPETPRRGVYTTSIVKCYATGCLTDMAQRCQRFLARQVALVEPKLVITLGKLAYDFVTNADISYDEALCTLQPPQILSRYGYAHFLMPWPHPSGLNRWHNDPQNKQKLELSFGTMNQFWSKRKGRRK